MGGFFFANEVDPAGALPEKDDGSATVASKGLGVEGLLRSVAVAGEQRRRGLIFCAPSTLLSRPAAHSMPHFSLYSPRCLSPRRWRGLISL